MKPCMLNSTKRLWLQFAWVMLLVSVFFVFVILSPNNYDNFGENWMRKKTRIDRSWIPWKPSECYLVSHSLVSRVNCDLFLNNTDRFWCNDELPGTSNLAETAAQGWKERNLINWSDKACMVLNIHQYRIHYCLGISVDSFFNMMIWVSSLFLVWGGLESIVRKTT